MAWSQDVLDENELIFIDFEFGVENIFSWFINNLGMESR